MLNIVIATVEFFPDKTEQTFADHSGNQLLINFKCLILGLQPGDKATILGVNTIEFFLEEFT